MQGSRILLSCLLFVPFLFAVPIDAKPQHCVGECRPGLSEYNQVLDAIFPLVLAEDPYAVLRFASAGQAEFQVNIERRSDRRYLVTKYSLPSGAPPIGTQIRNLRQQFPTSTAAELAKHIAVEKHVIPLPDATVSNLLDSLAKLRMPAQVSEEIVMDPSVYEFWFVARPACNVLHLAVSDADAGHDSKAHPLVRWMNRVRQAVEKSPETVN